MEKTYNVMRKKGSGKRKKTNLLLIFVGMAFAVMIISLFYIVVISTQTSENEADKKNGSELADLRDNEKNEFVAYFDGCDLLNNKCLNSNCARYFLCNDQKYKICEIYDCGAEFGIGTKDENGEVKIERRAKENRDKIIKVKKKCGGSLEIIESNLADEKLEAKIKVVTSGDCEISGFLVSCKNPETNESGNLRPVKFSNSEGSFYSISIGDCSEIAEIIAIGENGISIK